MPICTSNSITQRKREATNGLLFVWYYTSFMVINTSVFSCLLRDEVTVWCMQKVMVDGNNTY